MNIGNYLQKLTESIQYHRYSQHTVDSYVAQIDKFLKHFESVATKPSEISEKQITDYLREIPNTGSHRAALSAIKYFYKEVGRQPKKLDKVEYPRKQNKLPVVFSVEEIQKLFNVCDNLKHKVILSIMYSTGIRISELLNLKWKDIDRTRMIITVVQGKGAKDRQVMLAPDLLPLLEKYWYEYQSVEYVLNGQFGGQYSETSVASVLKQLARKAGIKKHIHPHLIRHCAFTHMVEAGTDINLIQRIAGHKSVKTTGIYLHISHNRISSITSPLAAISM